MGRINFTPLRVRQRALANREARSASSNPLWVDIVGDIPPAQVLVRPLPAEQPLHRIRTRTLPPTKEGATPRTEQHVLADRRSNPRHKASRKASKMFCPVPIRYEEDVLRKHFFSDHPWELARPRVLVETTGNSHAETDWSKGVQQRNFALSGESVVQRQLYLLNHVPDITVSQAYDIARKEFYDLRRQEETTRRIAAEEAQATGRHFGKDVMAWSLEIEDKQFEDWERWSKEQVIENMQKNAAFEGGQIPAEEELLKEAAAEKRPEVGDAAFAQETSRVTMQRRRVVQQ